MAENIMLHPAHCPISRNGCRYTTGVPRCVEMNGVDYTTCGFQRNQMQDRIILNNLSPKITTKQIGALIGVA